MQEWRTVIPGDLLHDKKVLRFIYELSKRKGFDVVRIGHCFSGCNVQFTVLHTVFSLLQEKVLISRYKNSTG